MKFHGAMSNWLLVAMMMVSQVGGSSRCEPMSFHECSFDGEHKWTIFPNKKGDQNIEDAKKQYKQFSALLRLECSPYLQQLICFYMFPACSGNDETVAVPTVSYPCRSLCEKVKEPCDRALRSLQAQGQNFNWDVTDIRCELLPEKKDDPNCIQHDLSMESSTNQSVTTVSAPSKPICETSVIKSRDTYVPRCGADVLFNAETKQFTDWWMIVWASLCCLASLLTFATIFRDKERFAYPERPVMFLALCYFGYSLAYLVRALAGAQAVSCERNQKSCDTLVREEMQPLCMVVFIVSYFFSLSAAVWWLMFTVGWLLSAAVKWSPEAIESRSSYFHVFAWAAPACLTSVVIVMRKVEGDELTGLCLVGVSQQSELLIFQIVPHAVLLFAGIVLLLAGFIAMTRIRNELMENGKVGTDKLEKLIVKVAVSAGFYIVPNLAILACSVYQYVQVPAWNSLIQQAGERHERRPVAENRAIAELFIFKIFMSFAVGISLLMWICSTKTLLTWRQCFSSRRANTNKRRPAETRTEPTAAYLPLSSVVQQSPVAPNANYRSPHSSSASRSNPPQMQNGQEKAFLAIGLSFGQSNFPLNNYGPVPSQLAYCGLGGDGAARLASVSAPQQSYPVQCGHSQNARAVVMQYKQPV